MRRTAVAVAACVLLLLLAFALCAESSTVAARGNPLVHAFRFAAKSRQPSFSDLVSSGKKLLNDGVQAGKAMLNKGIDLTNDLAEFVYKTPGYLAAALSSAWKEMETAFDTLQKDLKEIAQLTVAEAKKRIMAFLSDFEKHVEALQKQQCQGAKAAACKSNYALQFSLLVVRIIKGAKALAAKLSFKDIGNKLQGEGQKVFNAVKGKLQTCLTGKTWPDLVVIGGVGNLGPGEAGVEWVFDVHKKQIVPFAYGGLTIGTSSLTAAIGLYSGIGWKGATKEDDLAKAYSAWFASFFGGGTVADIDLAGVIAFSATRNKGSPIATNIACDQVITIVGQVGASCCLPIKVSAGYNSLWYKAGPVTNCGGHTDLFGIHSDWCMISHALATTPPPMNIAVTAMVAALSVLQ